MEPVIAAADIFMTLMLSRPGGFSLRRSWVTPATLLLAGLSTAAAAILAVLLLVHGGVPSVLGAAVLIAVCMGSSAVVAVGAAQRLARHS
jgi:hypothetical protein